MKNNELNFKDSEFVEKPYKIFNIEIKYNEKENGFDFIVPLNSLKEEHLTLSEDKKHYLLYVEPTIDHPNYSHIELEFKLAIEKEKFDKDKANIKEIIKRAFIEGDMFRSYYNPNADGRMRNVYYGGRFK